MAHARPRACTGGVSKLYSAAVHRGRVCVLVLFVFLSQAAISVFNWFLMAAPRVLLARVCVYLQMDQ
jgi:hypothetical protein